MDLDSYLECPVHDTILQMIGHLQSAGNPISLIEDNFLRVLLQQGIVMKAVSSLKLQTAF